MKVISLLLFTLLIIQEYSDYCQAYSRCCSSCNHQPHCCSIPCHQRQFSEFGTTTTPSSISPLVTGKPDGGDGSNSSRIITSSINTDNDVSVNAHFNIRNEVSNTNKIYIPVNISNINILTISSVDTSGPPPQPPTSRPPIASSSAPIVERTTLPTIYVYPILIPIPYPYPVHLPFTKQQGCCTVVQPCLQRQNNHHHCIPYHTTCGNHCSSPFMYSPINPCYRHGCFKRPHWNQFVCPGAQFNCGYRQHDCSTCDFDFYKDYHSYQRCGKCFY